MKRIAILLACALFAACGGGGPSASLPSAPAPAAAAASTNIGSVQFSALVPVSEVQTASAAVTAAVTAQAASRKPAYISALTQEFFVDLETIGNGPTLNTNPAFDYTLPITTTTCQTTSSTPSGYAACLWTVDMPVGVDTFLVTATEGQNGCISFCKPPPLLGAKTVTASVAPGFNLTFTAVLDAIAGAYQENNPPPALNYGVVGTETTQPQATQDYPYVTFALKDQSGDISFPAVTGGTGQPPVPTTLLNPITVSVSSLSGHINIAELLSPSAGTNAVDTVGPPSLSFGNVTTLAGIDGFQIVDTLPAGAAPEQFEFSWNAPAVSYTSTQIPQITTFPGQPLTTWGVSAQGVGIYITCSPPVAGTNPCTRTNGAT